MNTGTNEGGDARQSSSIMADIGGRDGEGAAPSAPAPIRKSKIPMQVVVVIAVVAASGGAIWWMKSASSGLVGRLSDLKIVGDISNDVAKLTPRQQAVLSQLDITQEVVQVDPDEITKNPFKLKDDMPLELLGANDGEQIDPRDAEAARRLMEEAAARKQREREIEDEFRKLTVSSIVGGSRPIAIVSGNPVRIGGRLGRFFTVTAIEGRHVTLEADGNEFVVAMQSDQP